MAGYIGNKAVNLSTSGADIGGDVGVGGNLLVGKTVQNIGTVGATVVSGQVTATADGADALRLNRLSSYGSILDIRQGGTTRGSIGVTSDVVQYSGSVTASFGAGDVGLFANAGNDALYPVNQTTLSGRDNAIDLGLSSNRFKDAYLSGGIFLGGTGAANKLDDYEEGTWTPTAAQGASAVTVDANNCAYTKVGRLVVLQFDIANLTSPTSDTFNLGGLPFAPASAIETLGSCMYQNIDLPGARTQLVVYGSPSNYLRFYAVGDSITWAGLIGNNLGTNFALIGSITYQTA